MCDVVGMGNVEAEAGGGAAAGDTREGDWEREGSRDRERVRYAEGKDLPPLRVRPRVGQSFAPTTPEATPPVFTVT